MVSTAGQRPNPPRPTLRHWQAKLLFAGAVGLLLYYARVAFVPIALALLLALVLSGPVESLHRRRVPRAASAVFIIVILIALLVGAVKVLHGPVEQWIADAPQTARIIKAKSAPLAKFLGRLEILRKSAGSIGDSSRAASAVAVAAVPAESTSTILYNLARSALVEAVTIVVVTLFLLAGGPPMLARMTAASANHLKAAHVQCLIEKVRDGIGRFYVTTGLINLGLGCATAAVVFAWGMPTPYLWGAMAAVLNFIPYVGSAITLGVLILVGMVTFDTVAPILGVAASYLALATLEGQIVSPMLVGRRLELNPLLVYLALWFGGLFWGVAGIILAMPLLIALKITAENSAGGEALVKFLGPNREPRGVARRIARQPSAVPSA